MRTSSNDSFIMPQHNNIKMNLIKNQENLIEIKSYSNFLIIKLIII
jgi:hypothetical protein